MVRAASGMSRNVASAVETCWIDQHRNPNRLGHQFVQQPQPLGRDLLAKKIDASRIAARSGKTGDQTKLDGVFANAENDRDRRGCRFGRK